MSAHHPHADSTTDSTFTPTCTCGWTSDPTNDLIHALDQAEHHTQQATTDRPNTADPPNLLRAATGTRRARHKAEPNALSPGTQRSPGPMHHTGFFRPRASVRPGYTNTTDNTAQTFVSAVRCHRKRVRVSEGGAFPMGLSWARLGSWMGSNRSLCRVNGGFCSCLLGSSGV